MNSGAKNIEEALLLTGYGKFHYSLAICCALCLLASGIQNGMNAYILPVAQCDLKLTSAQLGYLNASFLIGGISSAFIWGVLADLLGRKKVLLTTLLSDWCITIGAGLSQTYLMLLIFRYFNGFLIGSPGTLIFSYFAEFQPENIRIKAVCFIGMFFCVAWILLPAAAWVVMPLSWEFHIFNLFINSWRLYILFMSIPSLISGLWMIYLPESPKFLLSRGESKQALIVLKNMYSNNTGNSIENYQVQLLVNNINMKQVISKASTVKNVGRGKTARLIKDAKDQIKQLFKPPFLFYTILTSIILFANMFGYLGLGLWIPEILSRFNEFHELYPKESITLCELQSHKDSNEFIDISLSNITKYNVTQQEINSCENSLNQRVFMNTFIMGICCIIGNLLSAYFSEKVNRRILLFVTMLIGTISGSTIYWLNSSIQHLIAGSLFQASMATANTVLTGAIVDIFPTAVSAMAVCAAALAGRCGAVISNLVLGYLLDYSCEIPIIVIISTLLVGTILCFLIPTKDIQAQNEEQEPVKENYKSISDISIISTL